MNNDLTSTFLEFPCTTLIKIPFTLLITSFVNANEPNAAKLIKTFGEDYRSKQGLSPKRNN